MGRSKVRKIKPKKRKPPKLATRFNCPFCNYRNSIDVKLNKSQGVGELNCLKCGVTYKNQITSLDERVDLYSEWVDKCLDANKKENIDAYFNEDMHLSNFEEKEYYDDSDGEGRF